MASLSWKGYEWDLRDGGTGGPGFGGWSEDNASVDENDFLNLTITNPTEEAPVGVELQNQATGLGYGTYTMVVGTRLDNIDKNIVFGGMFPFFYGNPYIEFDANEVSKWDDTTSLTSHNVWYGSDPDAPSKHGQNVNTPSDVITTHRFIWEVGRATFDSFVGIGTDSVPYFHTVITDDVPVPSTERVYVNLWAYSDGAAGADDIDIPETTVVIQDFTFTKSVPIVRSIAAGADDGHVNNAASPVFSSDANWITVGRAGTTNPYSAFLRFDNVDIPAGSVITSAKVEVEATASLSGNNCNLSLAFCDEDDATAPVDVDTFNNKSLSTTVAWDVVESFTANNIYETPELKTALQEIIDRAGWASGQAVCLMLNNNSSSSNAYRQFKVYDAAPYNGAVLRVTIAPQRKYQKGFVGKTAMMSLQRL